MSKEMDIIEIGGVPMGQAEPVNPPASKITAQKNEGDDDEDDDGDDISAAWKLEVETDPVTNKPSYYYCLRNPSKVGQNTPIPTKDSCFKPGIFEYWTEQTVWKMPVQEPERKEPEKGQGKRSKQPNTGKQPVSIPQEPSTETIFISKNGPCFIKAGSFIGQNTGLGKLILSGSLTVDKKTVSAISSTRKALEKGVNNFDPKKYKWMAHSKAWTDNWIELSHGTAVEGMGKSPVEGFWMPTPELNQLPDKGRDHYVRIKTKDLKLMQDTSGYNKTDTYDQIYISRKLVEDFMANRETLGDFAMPTAANALRFWVRNATGRPVYFSVSQQSLASAEWWKKRYKRAISSPGGGFGRSLNVNIGIYIDPISPQYAALVKNAIEYANLEIENSKTATLKQKNAKAQLMTDEHKQLGLVQIGISPFGHYTTWIEEDDWNEWKKKRPFRNDNFTVDKIKDLQSSIEKQDKNAMKLKMSKQTRKSKKAKVSAHTIFTAKGTRDSAQDQSAVMGISAPTVAASCMGWKENDTFDPNWPISAPWMAEWLHRCAYSWGAYGAVPRDAQSKHNLIFGTYECNSLMTRYETAWQKLVIMLEKHQTTNNPQLINQIFWNADDDKDAQWPSEWKGARWLCRRLDYTLKLNIHNPDLPPNMTVNFYPLQRSFFTRLETKIDSFILDWVREKLDMESEMKKKYLNWITVIPTLVQKVKKMAPPSEFDPLPIRHGTRQVPPNHTADDLDIGTIHLLDLNRTGNENDGFHFRKDSSGIQEEGVQLFQNSIENSSIEPEHFLKTYPMAEEEFDEPSPGQSPNSVPEEEGLLLRSISHSIQPAKEVSVPPSTVTITKVEPCDIFLGNDSATESTVIDAVAHQNASLSGTATHLTKSDDFVFKERINLFGRVSADVYALESEKMSYLAITVPHLNVFVDLIPSLAGSPFDAIQLEDTTLSYRAIKDGTSDAIAELAVTTTVLMSGVLSPVSTFLREVLHQDQPRLVVSGMLSSHPDCLLQVPEPLGLRLRAELPDVSVSLFDLLTITHLGIDLMGTRRSAKGDYDFGYGFFGAGHISSDVDVSWYIHKHHDRYNINILAESSWNILPSLCLESVELGASWEGTDTSSVSLSLAGCFSLREGTIVLSGKYSRDNVELCGRLEACSLDTLQQLCEDVFQTTIQTQTTHNIYFSDMSLLISTKEGLTMAGTVTVDGHMSSAALIRLGPKGVTITGAIKNLDIPGVPTIHSASLNLSIAQSHFKVELSGMITVQEKHRFTVSIFLARSTQGLEYAVHGGYNGSFHLRNVAEKLKGTFLDVELTQLAICASNMDSPEVKIPDLPYTIRKGFQIYGQTIMHTKFLQLRAPITVCAAYGATDWNITGSYAGRVSLLETVSGLSTVLKECGLAAVSKAIDISIWDLSLSLGRNQKKNSTSVFFTADTDWLIFKHIRLSASTDSFTLGLVCQDDILSLTPLKDILGPYIKLNNTQAVVFLGAIDPAAFPPIESLASPRLAQRRNGFAVSSTIRLDTSALQLIKDLLQVEELIVAGMMTDTELMLAVGLKAVHLFHDRIIISGSFVVESRLGSGLFIGFQANFLLFFPSVCKSSFQAEAAFGLNLENYGMQLRLAVPSTLPNIFGIEGVELANIAVEATFNPAQGPVPTQFGFSGAIRLASVNDLRSSVNVRFSEGNPANSYLKGSIDHLNVPQLIHAFARNIPRSAAVDRLVSSDGLDLRRIAIEIVPHDMVGVDGSPLKQRIYFEADMSLDVSGKTIWSAYAFIDISMSSFSILALMSPIVLCPGVPGLFRITRNNIGYSEKAKNPVIPTPTQGNIDPAMLTDGPIMVIATDGKIDPPAFISGDMEIFGIRRAIYTRVDRDGFTIDLDSQSGPGPAGYKFNLHVQCDFNSSITVDLKINLNAFPSPISAIINDKSMNIHLGQGEIHLKLSTSWTDENPYFEGSLESTARVFGVEVKLHSFDVRLSPYELGSLEDIAGFVLREFQRRGIKLFQDALRGMPLVVAMEFVRNAFGKVVPDDSVFIRTVTNIADTFNPVNVIKALLSTRKGTREDAISMVNQLGLPENESALLLGQVLSTVEDLAHNVLGPLLKD